MQDHSVLSSEIIMETTNNMFLLVDLELVLYGAAIPFVVQL